MISVVVTGAAMGIGRAVAERLVDEGATVVAVDRDADALARTAADLGERVVPVEGDIAEWATHERAAELAEGCGDLAWWVNNAGVDISSSAHDATEQHIEDGLRVLLAGPMFGGA